MSAPICIIANRKSGGNSKDAEALDRAAEAFEGRATRRDWDPSEDLSDLIDKAVADGAGIIVAAGGDGTIMAVANAMVGRDQAMGVLPLGTFNFFARGLGLSEDPDEAARQIAGGKAHAIRVGEVNGQVFLNNASLGIYPAILKERETVYSRWGRFRLAAHWSVLKTMMRFRKPMRLKMTIDGKTSDQRTAMIFVARSAYQLDYFDLNGSDLISDDRFAVLVARARNRRKLLQLTWRLAMGHVREGRDYDLIPAREMTVEPYKDRTIIAYDGEKSRESGPFRFRMKDELLNIILPTEPAA